MKYTVELTDRAKKQLSKLDKTTAKLIASWIYKNLVDCENPRLHGKALSANHAGQWRYRVGNYRLIADIQDSKILILILDIGYRREIYR